MYPESSIQPTNGGFATGSIYQLRPLQRNAAAYRNAGSLPNSATKTNPEIPRITSAIVLMAPIVKRFLIVSLGNFFGLVCCLPRLVSTGQNRSRSSNAGQSYEKRIMPPCRLDQSWHHQLTGFGAPACNHYCHVAEAAAQVSTGYLFASNKHVT